MNSKWVGRMTHIKKPNMDKGAALQTSPILCHTILSPLFHIFLFSLSRRHLKSCKCMIENEGEYLQNGRGCAWIVPIVTHFFASLALLRRMWREQLDQFLVFKAAADELPPRHLKKIIMIS